MARDMEEAILPVKVFATGGPAVQLIAGALRRLDPDKGLLESSKSSFSKTFGKDEKSP